MTTAVFILGVLVGFGGCLFLVGICMVSREIDAKLEKVSRREAWEKLGWRY